MRNPDRITSLPADADYSATVARFVAVKNNGNAVLCGNGAHGVGVMYNSPAAGELARIESGNAGNEIEVGATPLALGDKVMSDANGKGIPAVGAGAFFFGQVTKAGAAGGIAEFIWAPGSLAG
jgi:hypothetical protein